MDRERYPTWTDYLKSMEKDGTWGDHLMLQAAANYYRTSICVISSLGHETLISPHNLSATTTNSNHQQPLVVGHIFELHYVSLIPRQGQGKS